MKKETIEWIDSDKIDQIFQPFVDGIPEFPVVCPECNSKSGHIYLNRYEDTHRGGAWTWCSSCHHYGHYSYIIPSWWNNLTCIDEEELCAGNADILEENSATIDEHINYSLRRNCMSKDLCKHCIRKEYKEPKITTCFECGHDTLLVELDGASMIHTCSSCGNKIVSASYFPPCCRDDLDYTITVTEIPKEKKVKVASIFELNVKALLDILSSQGKLVRTVKLNDAEDMITKLNELGIVAEVSPDITVKYPDLVGCQYR